MNPLRKLVSLLEPSIDGFDDIFCVTLLGLFSRNCIATQSLPADEIVMSYSSDLLGEMEYILDNTVFWLFRQKDGVYGIYRIASHA